MATQSNIPGLPGWDWEAKAWVALWLLVPVLALVAYFRAQAGFGNMDPFATALTGIGVLSFAVAVFWVPWLIRRRRTNALASLANDLGMKFTAHPSNEELAAFAKLSVFNFGYWASLQNLMVGQFDGADVLLVDYYCRVGPGGYRAHQSKTSVVIFPNASGDLPDFMLVPRVGLKTRASVVNLMLKGYPDLKIGKEPVHPFASHYWVSGSDGQALRDMFTPQVMDFFVENQNWNVEALNRHVGVYKIDYLVIVKDCAKRFGRALRVLKALTQR